MRFFMAVARTRLVLLVLFSSRFVFSMVGRPVMLGIMAGMNQTDIVALFVDNGSCMVKAGFTRFDTFRAWPVMFGIIHVSSLRSFPMVQTVRRTMEIPQFRVIKVFESRCAGRAVDILFVLQRPILMVQTIQPFLEIPQLLYVS